MSTKENPPCFPFLIIELVLISTILVYANCYNGIMIAFLVLVLNNYEEYQLYWYLKCLNF